MLIGTSKTMLNAINNWFKWKNKENLKNTLIK